MEGAVSAAEAPGVQPYPPDVDGHPTFFVDSGEYHFTARPTA